MFLILSIVVGGLVIGALGRLLVPGRQSTGILGTILIGVGGSVLGGIAARLIWKDPWNHSLAVIGLEVLGAALIVYGMRGRRHRVR